MPRGEQMLAQPGAMTATLAYYRAAMQPSFQDPALAEPRARLEGGGHFLHREKPDQVNALVLDWLRRT